jgi:imidazolonepropionase-like amidohydrolase
MKTTHFIMLLAFLGAACSTDSIQTYDLVVENVNLWNGVDDSLRRGANVYLLDGRIAHISNGADESAKESIDGTGKYLIPGLWDAHVHTTGYQRDFPRFVEHGVTSVLIPGGSTCTDAYYAEMRAMGEQDSLPAPKVFHTSQHFTLEGRHPVKTYDSPNWVEGETVYFLRDTQQITELVAEVAKKSIDGIKLTIEDGPHPPFVQRMPREFVNQVERQAARQGLRVFTHVSDNLEFEMAIDAGITEFLHFTGIDLDARRDSALLAKLDGREYHLVTTFMIDKSFLYPKFPEWVEETGLREQYGDEPFTELYSPLKKAIAEEYYSYFAEVIGKTEPSLADMSAYQVEDLRLLQDRGFNLVTGTDVGNTFNLPGHSLHEELELLVLGGMTPAEVLRMATINAARMLEVEGDLGTLEVGKVANMVLLKANPLADIRNSRSIAMVLKNGRVQE